MARIPINKSGEYAKSTGGWFTLKNDRDEALVVLLYEEDDGSDLDYFLLHEMDIQGTKRWVNCNAVDEEGNDHPEDCVLCQQNQPRIEKLFLQLYNVDAGENQTWDRGRSMVPQIQTFIEKYGALVTQPFVVIRNGKAGDQRTTYQLIPDQENMEAQLTDYEPRQDFIESGFILDVTDDEMWDMLDGKYRLPDREGNSNSGRRGAGSNRRRGAESREATPAPRRRTRETGTTDRAERGSSRTERSVDRTERTSERQAPTERRSRTRSQAEPEERSSRATRGSARERGTRTSRR